MFVLGTIIGSFLNVVILRFNTGQKIANDRSRCFSCNTELEWYNLVPLFSWLAQHGKCQYCKTKISIQYPLVELATGILFVLISLKVFFPNLFLMNLQFDSLIQADIFNLFNYFKLSTLAVYLIFFATYVVIFVYDLRHKIIPDEFSFGLAGFIFLFQIFIGYQAHTLFTVWGMVNLFAGVILALPFYALWKFSDGRWIGLGDAKLALSIGTLLGFVLGASAIILSFYIGAVFSLGLMLIQRLINLKQNITIKTEIPFGPFMIIATLLVFLFQLDIFGLSLFL